MKLHVAAVGRLRSGPELDLIKNYASRFDKTGRNLSLGPLNFIEVEDKKGGGKPAEAALLRKVLPNGALIAALDERGKTLTSPKFAETLANWRDQGRQDLCFVIGGADGIDPSLVAEADFTLSFGKMVWPHMLARVMLTEQLYRAAAILAGTPYHRV